jgi:hypothetical protein
MAKIDGFNVGKKYAVVTSTTPTGSVNSTSITLIHSILIPANTFVVDDVVTIETCNSKSATNNTFSQYFYINTSASLSGAILIATNTGIVAGTRAAQLYRRLAINVPAGTGNATIGINSTFNIRDDIGSTNNHSTGFSTLSINWTVDQYLIVAGSVVNTSDSLTCQWIKAANG